MKFSIITVLLSSCYLLICFAAEVDDENYAEKVKQVPHNVEIDDENYAEKVKQVQNNADTLCKNANMDEFQCNELKKILSRLPTDKEEMKKAAKMMPINKANIPPRVEL